VLHGVTCVITSNGSNYDDILIKHLMVVF